MDELLVADESPLAGQLDEPSNDATLYAEYRRLAAEQAALRRLATLVARGVEPSEVFDAVTKEMCRCVRCGHRRTVALRDRRRNHDGCGDLPPCCDPTKWPVGTRTSTAGNTLASMVCRTGGPARIDNYEDVAGDLAARVRAVGLAAAVGVPVIVDGRVRGLAAVGSARPGAMPADTEARISGFAELVATARGGRIPR